MSHASETAVASPTPPDTPGPADLGEAAMRRGDTDEALHQFKRCLLDGIDEARARRHIESLLPARAASGQRRLLLVVGADPPELLLEAVRGIRLSDPALRINVLADSQRRPELEHSGAFEAVLDAPDERFYEYLFFGPGTAAAQQRFAEELQTRCAGLGTLPEAAGDPGHPYRALARFFEAQAAAATVVAPRPAPAPEREPGPDCCRTPDSTADGPLRLLIVIDGGDPAALASVAHEVRGGRPDAEVTVLVAKAYREAFERCGAFTRVICEPDARRYDRLFYAAPSDATRELFCEQLEACCAEVSSVPTSADLDQRARNERIAAELRPVEAPRPRESETTTIWDFKRFPCREYPGRPDLASFNQGASTLSRPIDRDTPIASMGSCFARHIAAQLMRRGYRYLVTERPFRQGSAHWEQVYSPTCLRQIFEYTFDPTWSPRVRWWPRGDRLQDPFRRDILYGRRTCAEDFARHRQASGEALTEARVVILTLGLIETWRDSRDHATYYRVPSPRIYDPKIHEFHLQSVDECVDDLDKIQHLLEEHNPQAEIIVSVSPVPLFATFRTDVDAVTANSFSKSTLRVAAEVFAGRHANAHYFPAYEIVTQVTPDPYEADGRHVRGAAVDRVMQAFADRFADGGSWSER